MIIKELNDRYKFEEIREETLGMFAQGNRISDNQLVEVLALKPAVNISRDGLLKAVEENKQLAERMIPQLLLFTEVGNTSNGQYYIVSESTDLPLLADIIKTRKSIDADDVMAISYQLAYVLHQVRTLDTFHLNVNDRNVYVSLEKGNMKIRLGRTGFRHFIPEYSSNENRPVFWGSPETMAPEICSGKGASDTSDQYSLGILIYEMITGKPPFISKSPKTTIKRQVYEKPLPIHLVRPGFKNVKEIEKVLTKLLHKDPTQRYQDLTELMDVLGQIASDLGASVEIEQGRPDALPIEIRLAQEEVRQETSEPTPTDDSGGDAPARETMMFTGIVDEIEDAIKTKAEEAKKQADDASGEDVESDVTQELKGPAKETEPESESDVQHKETIAIVKEEIKAIRQENAKASKSGTQTGDEWFVSDSSELAPRDVFGEQKESKLFWVIIAVAIVVVGAAVAIFVGSGKKNTMMEMKTPEPINKQVTNKQPKAIKHVPVKPRAVKPAVAVKPAGTVSPVTPKPVAVPDATKKKVVQDAGIAKKADTKSPDKGVSAVPKNLPIVVKKAKKKAKKVKVAVKSKKVHVKKIEKKKTRRIVKKHRKRRKSASLIPAGMTPKQASTKYFKAGRAAEKAGNFKKALSNYRKVIKINPSNKLVPRLIRRIQAKMKK